uniref:Protein RFT1 homolog n=1 Tax=Ditylum brightwellii TaxID=49249 RepID=A0A6V2NRQ1_9STRA|mmetsp:Transcript_21499/g.28276  ORF Transcript_21499/g.28276 Transcript_21499/m.28276 type:complete len:190 (+) Transcript_21499:31-600(+)|eukprot:12466786-Ditylum_brightwellii.AAC.1
MQQHSLRICLVLLVVTCIFNPTSAFIKKRPVASKTEFSRERVKLENSKTNEDVVSVATATTQQPLSSSSPLISRKTLIQFDALVGIVYATGFFLFPGQTLSFFFRYDFDPSIEKILHMAVRMIAINHAGYIAGLLSAPPEKAIRVATAFLTIGGSFFVYYGQAKLETAAAFWSCTVLTTLMIVAHLIAL